MVFSLLSARTQIASCFFALMAKRWLINWPDTISNPQAKEANSRPNTIGAAIMVDKRSTPQIPMPTLAATKTVSAPSIVLTPRWYFYTGLRVITLIVKMSFEKTDLL